jgi:phage baseplate assembly protein W
VRKLVFEPASETLRGVVKARITDGLVRWLGHRLAVELVDVAWLDAAATLEVTVKYRPAGSADSRVVKFQRSSR